jgi:rod shape-determining protein MreC
VPGRKTICYLLMLLAVLVLLNLPLPAELRIKVGARDNLSPFHAAFSFVSTKVRGLGWYVAGAWRADGTRSDLLTEIAELKREVWQMHTIEEENEALRDLVGMGRERPDRLILAEIVARGDASGWWQTVRLNRGSEDGIEANLAVVTPRGLVGKTRVVSRKTTEVLLITDPGSRVACRLRRSSAFGVVEGGGVSAGGKGHLEVLYSVDPIRMKYLTSEQAISSGEEVITSGLGGVYPEGIPVGRIKGARLDRSRLYHTAEVLPSADLRRMRYVFVIVPNGGEAETAGEMEDDVMGIPATMPGGVETNATALVEEVSP